MKNIIICGLDRTGKDTQCFNLYSHFNGNHDTKPLRVFHSTKIDSQERFGYERYYRTMFEGFKNEDFIQVYNRFHFDEYVYTTLYKDYDPDYIWEVEAKHMDKYGQDDISLFLLLDEPDSALSRDDGLGYTSKLEGIAKEKALFEEAFKKSGIKNKHIINIQDFDLDTDKAFEFIKSKL
jgi:hypothetical protein